MNGAALFISWYRFYSNLHNHTAFKPRGLIKVYKTPDQIYLDKHPQIIRLKLFTKDKYSTYLLYTLPLLTFSGMAWKNRTA